jgi:hypothetical protein
VITINSGASYGTNGDGVSAISTVESNALRQAFVYSSMNGLDMSTLETVKSLGMRETFTSASFGTASVDFSSLKTIYEYGMYKAFINSEMNDGAVYFGQNLETVDQYGLYEAFYEVQNTVSNSNGYWEFKKLTSIGQNGMYYAFASAEICSNVSFGALEEVTNGNALRSCFYNNTKLQSASFPKLKRITGGTSFSEIFSGCTSLSSVSFPLLEEIGTSCCSQMFRRCTGLTSVSLPSIDPSKTTITGTTSSNNALYRMFYQCKNITELHFPASLSSYSSYLTKAVLFGGTSSSYCNANLQILFDL